MNNIELKPFGFSEMYEWSDVPDPQERFGKFVTFDKNNADKIVLADMSTDTPLVGISTINSIIDSDDPDEWKNKYLCNEIGDLFLTNQILAVGEKVYDENLELSFIRTRRYDHYVKVLNENFDQTQEYVKRSNRPEWCRINICGKAVVKDNGKCVPGEYCMPYDGKIKAERGTAVPATENSKYKFYVIERLSENSILVLNK